jgi:hypothetical protein
MSATLPVRNVARCSCGKVEFEAIGAPILRSVCYCDDCQEAGHHLQALALAPAVLDAQGGTAFVLYRKDRFVCAQGGDLLRAHKLRAASPTKRLIATCCNAAMLLGFDDAKWWVSVYRGRFTGPVAPVQMRICTRFTPNGAELPADVPRYARYPFQFIAKLLAARVAMLFGR